MNQSFQREWVVTNFSPRAAAAVMVVIATVATGGAARATQTDVTISMGSSSAAPRIVGTTVCSAKPGTPLLCTLGALGSSPLSFAATGLPSGVTLSQTGTLSGTTPAAGIYPIAVTVTSAAGHAQSTITLRAQDTLAATPPMGWNSYDSFGSSVTESETLQAAQAQQAILLPYGYRYVVVDFLWFDPQDVIDANGRFLPSTTRFPSATGSNGFKPLADQVHALGLNFGIHIMRGIPRVAAAANTPIANTTYTASDAANTGDPCPWDNHMWGVRGDTAAGQAWYDSIFAQYASWGIDFVKVDDMMNPYTSPPTYHQAEVDAIHRAIEKTGRSIVLSLSPGPMPVANATDLEANANQWRMVNDFWDSNGLSSLSDEFSAASNWQAVPGLGAGHWPDADMLPLGYLGPRCPVHASGPSALSHNQQVTVMTLWAILPSPLIFGGNEPMLSGDAWTTALLTNDEVLAVDQDADGAEAKLVSQSGMLYTWVKELSGGRKAVAFVNGTNQDATMSITFSTLGISAESTVRDAWHRTDLTAVGPGPSIDVPYQAATLLVIAPPVMPSSEGGAPDAAPDALVDASVLARDASVEGDAATVGDDAAGGLVDATTSTAPELDASNDDVRGKASSGCSCRVAETADSEGWVPFLALGAIGVLTAGCAARRRQRLD